MKSADSPLALVDDDAETRALVCEVLTDEGFRTVTAEDGEAGRAAAERHRPQVIVLDVKMRRMDGYTALMHLQFLPSTRDIPVVVLTGQEGDVYRILGGSGGAVAHLTKPFTPTALTEVVRRILAPGSAPA
jgi:CheY-like chemotaxis protein